MQPSTVIKAGHWTLTCVLLIMVIVGGMIWRSESGPWDDHLYSKKQLSDGVWLYITKYNNAGATDSDVYRYYLNKHLTDPLLTLKGSAPFLTTDTGSASVLAISEHVMVKLTGQVYSFSNSAFYYDGSTAMMPRIDLNSYAGSRRD